MKQLINIWVFIFCMTSFVNAQDIHFSHIHASPVLLNPAMTGIFDGKIRATANYKSQWNQLTNGYSTFAASIDTQIAELTKNGALGAGLLFNYDKAGDLNLTRGAAGLSISGIQALSSQGGGSYVSIGVAANYQTSSFDYANINAFDPEPELMDADFTNYWDYNVGVAYFNAMENGDFYLGAALHHINTPTDAWLTPRVGQTIVPIFKKWVVQAGGKITTSLQTKLQPSFIFTKQGPHQEILIGSFLKYKKDKQKMDLAVYYGMWYRWFADSNGLGGDALITALRLDWDMTYITFSFDINISSLREISNRYGGPELSVIQLFALEKRQKAKVVCPAFIF